MNEKERFIDWLNGVLWHWQSSSASPDALAEAICEMLPQETWQNPVCQLPDAEEFLRSLEKF